MVNVTALLYFAPTMDKILLRYAAIVKTAGYKTATITVFLLVKCSLKNLELEK
jgi:hypothetical protein